MPQETPRGSRLWCSQYFPLLRNIRISTNTPSQTPATRLSVYVTLDPSTSSVVASPFCSVELCLAIFRAVFTGFSCFLVVASERGFVCLSKNLLSSVQNKEEPPVHFKKHFCLFLTLQKVTMVENLYYSCFFRI